MTGQKSTGELSSVLKGLSTDRISAFCEENQDDLIDSKHPFAQYMRELIRRKGLLQQSVFINADIPERFGYKLIAEEKKTRRRDLILRLLLASHATLEEVQKALTLYGFSVLYPRIRRDIVFIIAFNKEIYDCNEVDDMLSAHREEPLYRCSDAE